MYYKVIKVSLDISWSIKNRSNIKTRPAHVNLNSGNFKVASRSDFMPEWAAKKAGVRGSEARQLLLETCIFRPHTLTCWPHLRQNAPFLQAVTFPPNSLTCNLCNCVTEQHTDARSSGKTGRAAFLWVFVNLWSQWTHKDYSQNDLIDQCSGVINRDDVMCLLMDHSSRGRLPDYLDKWRRYRHCQVRSSPPAPCRADGTVHMQFRVVAEEVPLFGTVKWACRLRKAPAAGDRTAFENVTAFSWE